MTNILEHFDALTNLGLKVIPLRENSKAPLEKSWTSYWDKQKARSKLKIHPRANIGLLLGDIIDVEGDSEEANSKLESLIGNCPHPSYRSARSVHHLFLTPDKNLRHFRVDKIEFRGHGHQSVLPPSQHFGVSYRWLKGFSFPIPDMPEELLKFYESNKLGRRIKNNSGVWCIVCNKQCTMDRGRLGLELEAFNLLGTKWACQKCRNVDIRPVCRKIKAANWHKDR